MGGVFPLLVIGRLKGNPIHCNGSVSSGIYQSYLDFLPTDYCTAKKFPKDFPPSCLPLTQGLIFSLAVNKVTRDIIFSEFS